MASQMSGVTSIPANGTVANVLTGQLYEFVTRPATVRFLLNSAATGLLCSIIVGSETMMQEGAIRFTNTMPSTQDDVIVTTFARQNDRLLLSARNTTGAAILLFWKVEVQYLQ